MNRALLLSLILPIGLSASAQQAAACKCEVFINPEFKGSVAVYDRPGGKKSASAGHDREKEDYLHLAIDKDSAGFFHGTITRAIDPEFRRVGWFRKAAYFGIYARNYNPGKVMKLYKQPAAGSTAAVVVSKWSSAMYQVNACRGAWLYVSTPVGKQTAAGWLSPDMQCANVYTTCN